MITQKRRKYFRLLSIVISFVMIVTAIPFIPVVADIEEGIASMLPDPIEPIEESDSEGSTTFALDPNGLCPANLEDGVYAIKNVGNSTSTYSMFMDMAHNHWFPEYHIQQNKYTGTQTPCDPFSPRALFKITKNGNSYVIRVLRNSLLSFQLTETSRGYEYLTVEIPQVDEDVPYASRFSIMETTMYSNEYVITQCNTSKYVSAQATAAYGDEGTPGSYLFGSDSITAFSTWTFVKYTGEERSSVNMLGWGSLVTGTQMMFYPVFYSTRPGYNILSLDIQSPGAGNYSVDESNPYGKIRLTPYTDQDIVVDVKVGNGVDSYTIATQTWPVRLVVEEGIYFLKNVKFDNRYVQINNTSNMYEENEIIELHNFHGYYEQRWEFTHLWNGYYKIESTYSRKVLTCPTGPNSNIVRQTTFTNALTQSWKIVEQSDGTYKMYAGSNSNCYMTAGTPTATADPDLIVRSPQSDGGDRWYIISLDLPTTVYTQVFFDNGYRSRYPNAISIIYEELASLKEIYMDEFGIDVCWFTPTPYISYADECSTAYNATCNHVLDIGCENSSISSDGSIFLKSYHHKNIYNIFLRVPFPDTTENLKILYMGHDNCMVRDSVHMLNPLNGTANRDLGLAMIMNFKSQLQETKTLVHEFGHFYGAKDHYGNGTPTTEELNDTIGEDLYSDYCIYGLHKELASVCDSLTICEGCRITIAENKYRYGLE